MKGEQKEMRDTAKELGAELGKSEGKAFREMAGSLLEKQMVPKNLLGMSDAMVEGIYGQAYRLYNSGKYKDATQLFRLLIMLNGTEPKYALGLAACFHMMKEYASAVGIYALCGTLDPKSPIPHYHASDCYMRLKDRMSAIVSLEMAVKLAGEKEEYRSLKDRALLTIENLKKEEGVKEKVK